MELFNRPAAKLAHKQRAARSMQPAAHTSKPAVAAKLTDVAPPNVVVWSSATGGAGTSTLAAMTACQTAVSISSTATSNSANNRIALIDADIGTATGGLDVLLGLEAVLGTRWDGISAPLGTLNGAALWHELPQWQDGVRVLAFRPWQSDSIPAWWEITAAVEALAEHCSLVIVDAGRGAMLREVPVLARARQMLAVQLSVLGAVRGRMQYEWLRAGVPDAVVHRTAISGTPDAVDAAEGDCALSSAPDVVVIGTEPLGCRRGRGALSVPEVEDYLGCSVTGPVPSNLQLAADVLEGEQCNTSALSRKHRRVLDDIVKQATNPDAC